MKILVTGSNGYIASRLIPFLEKNNQVIKINRQNLDLKNSNDVDNFFNNHFFDAVIHTAIEGGSRLRKDSSETLDNNLAYYYNILNNKNRYNKFISFGSGAEKYDKDSYYGLSKKVIRESMLHKNNFFNIRIFAVFDEEEADTRFIKRSIQRYINKKNIEIHKDKEMDFFYMKDLISVINFYLNNESPPKEFDCSYQHCHKLTEIASIINSLTNYKVDIKYNENELDLNYTGTYKDIGLKYIGLEKGIKEVYENLNNRNTWSRRRKHGRIPA